MCCLPKVVFPFAWTVKIWNRVYLAFAQEVRRDLVRFYLLCLACIRRLDEKVKKNGL